MKNKVLFVIGSLQLGGAEVLLNDILNNIDKTSQVDLLLIEKRGELLKSIPKNIKVYYLTKGKDFCKSWFEKVFNKIYLSLIYRFLWDSKMYSKFIHKHILKNEYTKEIGFLSGVSTAIVRNTPNKKTNKIMWIHIDVLKVYKKSFDTYKKDAENFDKIIAISDETKENFIKAFPNTNEKVVVIKNFIDTNKVIKRSLEESNVFPQKNCKNILCCGRVEDQKGYDMLLEAVLKLNKENYKYMLYIIGIGSEMDKLLDFKNENNLDNVIFLGVKSNPYPYIKECDLFLMSSRYEGYSIVLNEALILEKKILTTNTLGPKEILAGYNNYLICDADIQGIYIGLKFFLDDKIKKEKDNNSKFKVSNNNSLKQLNDLINK